MTASGDYTARVWNVRTGRAVLRLLDQDREISAAVFSADGERIATASWDGTTAIRMAGTGEII
ncbi:MAG: WD40 repeat domain-containing protein [Egibacteraceae bacterium]